jgi:DNA (cytosine-5)-methyltransferase 1
MTSPDSESGKCTSGTERTRVLNLYAGIGGNRHLWADVEVTAVENDENIAAEYQRQHPDDDVVIADAHEFLKDHYNDGWDFIWASPPCQTHSTLSFASWHSDYAHNAERTPEYPDMRLYQEVILLDNLFDGDWVVENVDPYYGELLDPQRAGRHLFWSNYHIPSFEKPERDFSYGGEDGRTSDRQALEEWLGIELAENLYVGDSHDPAQVLRNAVHPELGQHVFEARDTTRQATLVAADGGRNACSVDTGTEHGDSSE